MAELELYGTKSCRFTAELREDLLWQERDFTEYDIEEDPAALERMMAFSEDTHIVPVLVENGTVVQIGWHGQGCFVGPGGRVSE
jgi:glutaredoxin 3